MHSGPYGIPLFDTLDQYLPALLYDRGRFRTVPQVLNYVHQQAQFHLNPLTRREREWRREQRPAPAAAAVPTDNEAFVTALGTLFGAGNTNPHITVAQMDITNLMGGIDLTPVTVRPTQTQLDRATDVETGTNLFTVDDGATCTVCQETFRSAGSGSLRRIRHCGHIFHQNCIDTWFGSHVRCPVCRYDIREYNN